MPATKKLTKTNKKLKFSNVTGRKKVMLISLFVFVAVGAGIIIRSFAATATSTYNYANGLLVPKSGFVKVQSDTITSSKSPESVLYMGCAPETVSPGSGSGINSIPTPKPCLEDANVVAGNNNSGILPNQHFRLCVTEKGGLMTDTGNYNGWVGFGVSTGYTGPGGLATFRIKDETGGTNTPIGNGYYEYCTPIMVKTTGTLTGPWGLTYSHSVAANYPVRISAFTIKSVDEATATPVPTK